MKQGIPKSLYQAEFLPENGEQRGSPQQLYHQGSFQDKTCQAHDPAHIRRSDGLRIVLRCIRPIRRPEMDTESTGHLVTTPRPPIWISNTMMNCPKFDQ